MNAFSLPSIFFGIYLIVPLLLGCFLVFGVNIPKNTLTKAQRLAGVLFLVDALYLAIRTYLLTVNSIDHEVFRHTFFILDSSIITYFTLIPYTVISERYPKWWMYPLCLLPLTTLPFVTQTQTIDWTAWSHLLPLTVGTVELTLSINSIRKYDQNLVNEYADPEHRTKSWLIYITIGFILVTLASLLRYLIHGVVQYNIFVSLLWSTLMIAIYVFLVQQRTSDVKTQKVADIKPEPVEASPTAGKSENPQPQAENQLGLTADSTQRLLDSVESHLEKACLQDKLYLNVDLTLDMLAQACHTNRTYISFYLRERKQQTFYEYINTLRLSEVDKLLTSRISQEAIATKCGYNSARTMRNVYQRFRGKPLEREK